MNVARINTLHAAKRRVLVHDQVHVLFASASDSKPCARESKRRPLNLCQLQDLAIELPRSLEIADRDTHVMKDVDLH